jgi:hypothetical protein
MKRCHRRRHIALSSGSGLRGLSGLFEHHLGIVNHGLLESNR